jgi:hypothetical protein
MFENVARLTRSWSSLDAWLKNHHEIDDDGLAIAIDICHYGELLLLFQRRLAVGMGAYGFLHGKDAIEHAAHPLSSHTSRRDLEQLSTDVGELLAAFDTALREDARLLVDSVSNLPENLKKDFRTGRDLCSVGFEDVALMVCGRGLKK